MYFVPVGIIPENRSVNYEISHSSPVAIRFFGKGKLTITLSGVGGIKLVIGIELISKFRYRTARPRPAGEVGTSSIIVEHELVLGT